MTERIKYDVHVNNAWVDRVEFSKGIPRREIIDFLKTMYRYKGRVSLKPVKK